MQALIALCFKSLLEVLTNVLTGLIKAPAKTAAPDAKVYLIGPANVPTVDDLSAKYDRL